MHHVGIVSIGQLIKRRGHWSLPIEKLLLRDFHLTLLEYRLSQALIRPDALTLALAIDIIVNPINALFLEYSHCCSLPFHGTCLPRATMARMTTRYSNV